MIHSPASAPTFPSADSASSEQQPATVLRCAGTADFLAALPILTGFTAPDSLFLVLFIGKRAGRAIRIDLPANDSPRATTALLHTVCELLRETGAGPHGPALVITCERTFADAQDAPWRRLAQRIERRCAREGWWLRELACVAPDGWVSYRDPSAPRLGRPLQEIERSAVRTVGPGCTGTPPALAALGSVPAPSPVLAAAVLAELMALTAADPTSTPDASEHANVAQGHLLRTIASTGAALSQSPDTLDSAVIAQLIHDAGQPHTWLMQALTALTRPEFVRGMTSGAGAAALVALTETPHARSTRRAPGGRDLAAFLIDTAEIPPDQAKLRRAIAIWEVACAHAPRDSQPGMLCLLAWAWWSLGLQSVSERMLRAAEQIDPDCALVRVLQPLHRRVPGWLLREGSAG